jgi:putative ATP-dependent endonuclease of the OLD family
MTKLIKLEIENFRSIQKIVLDFPSDQNLYCFIGRGDSGKTTVLEAISMVLSPTWNLPFHDTDFHNCQYRNPIDIKATLIDFPAPLIAETKFGLHLRGYDTVNKKILDDIINEEDDAIQPALTLRLLVDQHLEPKWTIYNTRNEEKPISASDRSQLSCFLVADQLDRHFSWNKGNPLYSLLKTSGVAIDDDDANIIIQSLRDAKTKIDEHKFPELKNVTDLVTTTAASLGLNILHTNTTLDFKELAVKEGRISLHENSIPFRLKGKGTKRLASLAIQLALIKNGGIMLVDEIEQGLEPDRIRNLIRTLKEFANGQILLATHSRDVITELGPDPLILFLKQANTHVVEARKLAIGEEALQKAVRACPEAFFAKKIIVCEGATEVGLCRALDKFRSGNNLRQMAFQDCAFIDGTGNTLAERATQICQEASLKTALLCDSDDLSLESKKPDLTKAGITLFECETGNCLESQVLKDLPWQGIQDLIQYIKDYHFLTDPTPFQEAVKAKYGNGKKPPANWLDTDTPELRTALGKAFSSKDWLKRVDHGEFLGDTIFKYWDQMEDTKHLKKTLSALSNWIDS